MRYGKAGRRQLLPKVTPGGNKEEGAPNCQDHYQCPTSRQHESPPQAAQPPSSGRSPALFPRSLPPVVSSFPGFHIQTPLVRRPVSSDQALSRPVKGSEVDESQLRPRLGKLWQRPRKLSLSPGVFQTAKAGGVKLSQALHYTARQRSQIDGLHRLVYVLQLGEPHQHPGDTRLH